MIDPNAHPDTVRLDFYEENLETDRARDGTVSVWMDRGWGDEYQGSTLREAIDAAMKGKNPSAPGVGRPDWEKLT
jgi:hypothetical protein